MLNKDKTRTLLFIISPYGLATISLVIFVAAWIFPPATYERLMDERDLMFLDPRLAFFYALCVTGFLLGVFIIDAYAPSGPPVMRILRNGLSPAVFILCPLIVALVLDIVSTISVLQKGVLLPLLLTGDGTAIKNSWQIADKSLLTAGCLSGVIFWTLWRHNELWISKMSRIVTRMILYLAVLCVVVSTSMTLNRGTLVPFLIGLGIVLVAQPRAANRPTIRATWRPLVLSLLFVALVFVLFSVLRGTESYEDMGSDLLGYTIASYNRLSALLAGTLHYTYAGKGLYLSGDMVFNNTLNTLLPVREAMNWPSYEQVWQSEFSSVWHANLNGNAIWCGAFGYIYLDLGWCSPVLLFLYGALYGLVWRSFRLGYAFGVVIYPWCAFCVLFWFGMNFLLWTPCAVLIIDAIILSVAEFFLLAAVTPSRSYPLAGAP